MSESIGSNTTSEWYTPRWFFESMGHKFNLDPCAPKLQNRVVPSLDYCDNFYTENGLKNCWFGSVFMNPPWSGSGNQRGAIKPWLEKFVQHGQGVCIFPSRTSCDWFQEYIPMLDAIVFPNKKIKFLNSELVVQKQPMQAVCIGAIGEAEAEAIKKLNGFFLRVKNVRD